MHADPARTWRWTVVVAVILSAILVPFLIWGPRFEASSRDALLETSRSRASLLVVGLLAVDVFLPVPSSVVSTSAGALLGWAGGTAASTAGMTLGALIAYVVGRSGGRSTVARWVGGTEMDRFDRVFSRVGGVAIVLARPIPVLAESSAFLSGVNRFPLPRFVCLTVLANLAASAIYAAVGVGLLTALSR